MSRSNYSDDIENWDLIRWRGQVASSIRGKRGQAFLKALLEALDEMQNKRLIAEELETGSEVCAIGCLGRKRKIDMSVIEPHDYEMVAKQFDIADCLAQEVVYENDEGAYRETPEERWTRMRAWVAEKIKP